MHVSTELPHSRASPLPQGLCIYSVRKGVCSMGKTVAILIFPGVQSLDVTGPMDVFCEANRFLVPEDHYQLEVIGIGHGTMAASNGLSLQAHRHYREALQAYDLLLVAGGPQLQFEDFGPDFDDWLRSAAARDRKSVV